MLRGARPSGANRLWGGWGLCGHAPNLRASPTWEAGACDHKVLTQTPRSTPRETRHHRGAWPRPPRLVLSREVSHQHEAGWPWWWYPARGPQQRPPHIPEGRGHFHPTPRLHGWGPTRRQSLQPPALCMRALDRAHSRARGQRGEKADRERPRHPSKDSAGGWSSATVHARISRSDMVLASVAPCFTDRQEAVAVGLPGALRGPDPPSAGMRKAVVREGRTGVQPHFPAAQTPGQHCRPCRHGLGSEPRPRQEAPTTAATFQAPATPSLH